MTCRSCGTTIADKAIVCFRCGQPTADSPPPTRHVTAPTPWGMVAVLVAMAGLGIWLISRTPGDPWMRWTTWAMLAGVTLVAVYAVYLFRGPRSGKMLRR